MHKVRKANTLKKKKKNVANAIWSALWSGKVIIVVIYNFLAKGVIGIHGCFSCFLSYSYASVGALFHARYHSTFIVLQCYSSNKRIKLNRIAGNFYILYDDSAHKHRAETEMNGERPE